MKSKVYLAVFWFLLVVLGAALLVTIGAAILYAGSISISPVNIWNQESLASRIHRLSSMGWSGVWQDIKGEFRSRFGYEPAMSTSEGTVLTARTHEQGFQIYKNGQWRDLFVKGVNIGAALPGHWFTEFPRDEKIYLDWFEKIGAMNANAIRVYTLLPPEFYRALYYYNAVHTDRPLWLFQELWPEENPPGGNYLERKYREEYLEEIKRDIDAIHGEAVISERRGRAWGIYDRDVSPYVLGYLVGRELEPEEVAQTNAKNRGFNYSGRYLGTEPEASPTEAWLAMNCDYALQYEEITYGTQHPVGIVSWPTLDPIEHEAEWNEEGLKSKEYNDREVIDINHIAVSSAMKAGFFGAYHIYPNYPDFMNNELKYAGYRDEEGTFRYGGYLREFIKGHRKYPALVAEFGLATGMGNAHANPDGYNHGGLTEIQQGRGIVRMMKAIKQEGYAGGVIFEWMDEWAKKTWLTEPFMIPYERHIFWHNVLDPEQNYGIYAHEAVRGDMTSVKRGQGIIKELRMGSDASFLYIDVQLGRALNWENDKLLIGLDTYDRKRGEYRFAPELKVKSPTGLEFVIELTGSRQGRILVNPGYNISKYRYSSTTGESGIFEEIRLLINKARVTKDGRRIEEIYQDGSRLYYGGFKDNSHNHWYVEGSTVHIRIPWGRLNVTDPLSHQVLDDPGPVAELARDTLRTVKTDGIAASIVLADRTRNRALSMLTTSRPYLWEGWDQPEYRSRLKKSYYIIKDYFGEI